MLRLLLLGLDCSDASVRVEPDHIGHRLPESLSSLRNGRPTRQFPVKRGKETRSDLQVPLTFQLTLPLSLDLLLVDL